MSGCVKKLKNRPHITRQTHYRNADAMANQVMAAVFNGLMGPGLERLAEAMVEADKQREIEVRAEHKQCGSEINHSSVCLAVIDAELECLLRPIMVSIMDSETKHMPEMPKAEQDAFEAAMDAADKCHATQVATHNKLVERYIALTEAVHKYDIRKIKNEYTAKPFKLKDMQMRIVTKIMAESPTMAAATQ